MSFALQSEIRTEENRDRSSLPPMLRQYLEYKDAHPDCLVLIQVGDFYEAFFSDAVKLARTLNVTLTSRDKSSENPIPMAGVPIAVVDGYVSRLVATGESVAIVSQLGTGGSGKGMVERKLERIITPGIQIQGEDSAASANATVAAVYIDKPAGASWDAPLELALAYADVTTGKMHIRLATTVEQGVFELKRIAPVELVLPSEIDGQSIDRRLHWVRRLEGALGLSAKFRRSARTQAAADRRDFSAISGYSSLSQTAKKAVRQLAAYVDETTVDRVLPFAEVAFDTYGGVVRIDATTGQNLELLKNLKDGSSDGTLLGAIDRTATVGGLKLLRRWLSNPSSDIATITARQDAVAVLLESLEAREALQAATRYMVDFDRLAARLELGVAHPSELGALRDALQGLPALVHTLNGIARETELLSSVAAHSVPPSELLTLLVSALSQNPPPQIKDGGTFKEGFDEELDRLRSLKESGASWILQLEASEREKTGISSLKIKHNNVHGYFFEVTKANAGRVPGHFTKKQTTSNAERFVTSELKEIEEQIVGAQGRLCIRERELYEQFRERVRVFSAAIRTIGESIAVLDVLISFATVAEARGFVRPEIDETDELHIVEGKHPVLAPLLDGRFVPNSVHFERERRCAILTGANMGGKSTYLRQTALIVVLAQAGSFVPARAARIGLVDRIFARLGASDDLLEGESTFMVEMREAAHIVSQATERSLLVIDEIGRGTATADGLAIARAILEWVVNRVQSRTLFATHFHELTELESTENGIFNISVGSVDDGEDVVFTHEIVPGPANRSYGLEVAKIAGLPPDLLRRATVLLQDLARQRTLRNDSSAQISLFEAQQSDGGPVSEGVGAGERESVALKELRAVDINALTPVEALVTLANLQRQAVEEE